MLNLRREYLSAFTDYRISDPDNTPWAGDEDYLMNYMFFTSSAFTTETGWSTLISLDNLEGIEGGKSEWHPSRLLDVASLLCARNQRPQILGLLEKHAARVDETLADKLIARALKGATGNERRSVLLAALGYLAAHKRYDRAESMLAELLADPALSCSPALWHLGALLALDEKQYERAVVRQEHSLNLEYAQRPENLDSSTLLRHVEELLSLYEKWIRSLRDSNQPVPVDLVQRVVRMTDRWRDLDPNGKAACTAAASVLRLLGAEDLARDYETTALIGEDAD